MNKHFKSVFCIVEVCIVECNPDVKCPQTVSKLNRYNLSLLGITEARWIKMGKQKLSSGEVIIWSGRQDDVHQEGVALLINKKYTNTLLEWNPINERLLYVRLNSKYAKDQIYSALQTAPPTGRPQYKGWQQKHRQREGYGSAWSWRLH